MPDKYLPLNDALYTYCNKYSKGTDDPVLAELQAETRKLGDIAMMQISPEQGSFLTLITRLMNAATVLEIGTFTGYSAICLARGLAQGGQLICCDVNEDYTAIARKFWAKAGLEDQIHLELGDATETLPQVLEGRTLDLVFIDADKPGYDKYFEMALPKVRTGGLIIFDNMLNGGRITHAEDPDAGENTRALHQMNEKLRADPRVENVLLPIADGLQLCRKR